MKSKCINNLPDWAEELLALECQVAYPQKPDVYRISKNGIIKIYEKKIRPILLDKEKSHAFARNYDRFAQRNCNTCVYGGTHDPSCEYVGTAGTGALDVLKGTSDSNAHVELKIRLERFKSILTGLDKICSKKPTVAPAEPGDGEELGGSTIGAIYDGKS